MKKFIRAVILFLTIAVAGTLVSACSSGPRVINVGGSGQGVVIYD